MMYSARELAGLPTITQTMTADLKIDDGELRVWLERTTVADGEPCDNKVTVERYTGHQWVTVDEYPGGDL